MMLKELSKFVIFCMFSESGHPMAQLTFFHVALEQRVDRLKICFSEVSEMRALDGQVQAISGVPLKEKIVML